MISYKDFSNEVAMGSDEYIPYRDLTVITLTLRDINGKRMIVDFFSTDQLINWVKNNEITNDNYEILLVRLNSCYIYSSLQASEGLTFEELVGFFG